jgi:multiple sugar transport system substrate-binding protein
MDLRKKWCIPLVITLALALAASCSPKKADSVPADSGQQAAPAAALSVNEDGTVNNPEDVAVDPNKLVFWSLFSGGDGAWMDRIIGNYNGTGPSKQVQSVMLVWADYYTKFGTAVAARRGPDIGVSHISRLPELVEQGMVIPLDDYASKAGVNWNDFAPSMVEGITFDGKKYAMPLDTHAEIMYINTDKLSAAGIDLSGGQGSISDVGQFKALLDQIKPTLQSGESVIALTQNGDDPYRVWWAVYFQMGGTPLVNDAGTEVTFDRNIAAQAAEVVKSLYTDGYVLPGIEDHGRFFQSGRAALMWGGTWNTGFLSETTGLNFAAQPFPRLFGTNDACWADAHVYTIPAKRSRSDADTQAAVNFTYWAVTQGGAVWAESGQIPSNIPVQSSPAFTALPYRTGYARAASTAVLPSKNVYFGSFKDSMIKNLDLVWVNQATAAAAAQSIYEEIASAIRN